MIIDDVLKYSLLCVVNGQRYLRMTSEPLLVRYVTGALPVCELTVAISLIKHSVTFKNDPYPVFFFTFYKKCIDSKHVKFIGYTAR